MADLKRRSATSRLPPAATDTEALGYEFTNSPRGDDPRERRRIGDVHVLTLKERAQRLLDGPAGLAAETLNVLLSIVLVVMAVADTYEADVTTSFSPFEIACMFFFLADYGLHLFASADRMRFIVSPIGLIDAATILPTLVTLFLVSLSVSVASMLRVARIFRLLAILRLYRIVQAYRGYDYQLAVLAFLIVALVMVAAGVFQALEQSYYADEGLDPLQFHVAVYFVFVTVATVGYGDISPRTAAGQIFVVLLIIVIVTAVPRQINHLVELSKLQHGYMHSYSLRKRDIHYGGHVVVTGHVTPEAVAAFLHEFYRSRQGRVNMDVVLLADHAPSDRIQALLLGVRFRRRVTFLKGSLLRDKDARRAHVDKAAAVFILANKKARGRQAEAADALAVLQALAVDKFRFRSKLRADAPSPHGRIRCFLEVLAPQRTRGLRAITGVEVALNAPRLRSAILARSILCPGATALLLNLLYSAPELHVAHGKASHIPWIAEYAAGLQHLLFPVCLPRSFDGLRYRQAAAALYQHFQVMLVGLYDDSAATEGRRRVRLCPFHESLRAHDIGFLIAPSASAAKLAVDSLELVLDASRPQVDRRGGNSRRGDGAPLSTLVFSSDTVLNRQSFAGERSHSLRLDEDVHVLVEKTDDSEEDESVHSETTLPSSSPHMHRIQSDSTLINTSRPSAVRRQSTAPTLHHSASYYDRSRHLHGHIVVCGPIALCYQLAWHLDALFSLETTARPTLVLLVKSLPTEAELAAMFPRPLPPNCELHKGVSQAVEDLIRVRASESRAVVFVPGSWTFDADELGVDEAESESVEDHLLDYQVIMSTLSLQTIQKTRRGSHPVLSISVVRSRESIQYFAYKISKDDHEHHERAAGRHDPLYHHHHHHDDTRHEPQTHSAWGILGRHSQHHVSAQEAELLLPAEFAPAYAAGEVFVDSFLDTLLCQSFFNPYVVDLVRALAGDCYYHNDQEEQKSRASGDLLDGGERYFQHAVLSTATIARELSGESFQRIFERALEQETLVVAIYRHAEREDESGRGNARPYVFTCPDGRGDYPVERGDALHVLSRRRPPICIV